MVYQIQSISTSVQHAEVIFTCHNHTQEIESETGKIRLRSKLWEVFTLLVNRSGQIIKREVFINEVWSGNYFTGPAGLSHSICHLRQIIDNLKLPIVIITIPKKGYRIQPKLNYGKTIHHNMVCPSHSIYSLKINSLG